MGIVIVIITLVLLLVSIFLFFGFVFRFLEEMFVHLFNKPFYVHWYPRLKSLTPAQEYILRKEVPFYNSLSERHKKYFGHRVVRFINKYQFIEKDFVVTDQVKVLIASTSITLTFGMREYLFNSIDKIIIYPTKYVSVISNQYHKGEFNPRAKAIVFSWEDFIKGFEVNNDNLNLGIHEFVHVLHYEASRTEESAALIFRRMYRKITLEVNQPENSKKLIDSDYFRIYAYTDRYEFLAVIIEHYFETPLEFRQEFPELYKNVSIMLNHRHRY